MSTYALDPSQQPVQPGGQLGQFGSITGAAPGQTVLPSQMRLSANPQLPMTAQQQQILDSTYSADQSAIAADISQRYNDVLKQLGYMDPTTNQFIMGTVEANAQRQAADYNRSIQLADEQETQQRQLEGTLFSGRRATEQARAEHPFVQSLADLDISTPQTLSDLYEQAGNLMTEYTVRNNQALAAAAQRRAQAIQNQPAPPTPTPQPPSPPGTPNPPSGGTPAPGGTTPVAGGPFVSAPGVSNVTFPQGAGAGNAGIPTQGQQITDVYANTPTQNAAQYGSAYQGIWIDANGNSYNSPGPGRTQVW